MLRIDRRRPGPDPARPDPGSGGPFDAVRRRRRDAPAILT